MLYTPMSDIYSMVDTNQSKTLKKFVLTGKTLTSDVLECWSAETQPDAPWTCHHGGPASTSHRPDRAGQGKQCFIRVVRAATRSVEKSALFAVSQFFLVSQQHTHHDSTTACHRPPRLAPGSHSLAVQCDHANASCFTSACFLSTPLRWPALPAGQATQSIGNHPTGWDSCWWRVRQGQWPISPTPGQ